jgi:hypothetical protein
MRLRQIEQQSQKVVELNLNSKQVSARLVIQNSPEAKSRNRPGLVPANFHSSMAKVIVENTHLRQENTQLLTETFRQQDEIRALKAQLAMQKTASMPTVSGAGLSPFAFMKAPPAANGQVGQMQESMQDVERSPLLLC